MTLQDIHSLDVYASVPRMEYRRLGTGGLTISAIAYGTWLTHTPDAADLARECVAAALDEGITTFDTADIYGSPDYGSAERLLGAALSGVRRASVEILTKVCLPTGPGPNDRGLSRKHIVESCNASLRNLGTDYIDLYQAHRYDENTPLEETMTAFADLVRQGKVLYLGVSEWSPAQIEAAAVHAAELKVPLISNQPQYSLLWRVIEEEVVPTCTRLGIGQIVFSPVAQGVLTGKYRSGGRPCGREPGHAVPRLTLRRPLPRRPGAGRGAAPASDRRRAGPQPVPARHRLGAAEPGGVRRRHRSVPPRPAPRERRGHAAERSTRTSWTASTPPSSTRFTATSPNATRTRSPPRST